jgi:CheY-like chemotaxis protein
MMLRMTGTDLAQRLNAIRPDIPIILTTGPPIHWSRNRLRAAGVRQLLTNRFRCRRWPQQSDQPQPPFCQSRTS